MKMRMKERGLGTGAIVGIVVVVVAVVVGVVAAVLLMGGGGTPGGMSVYPGATGYDLPSEIQAQLPAGCSIKAYTTSDSVSDVMTWYKGHMSGWTFDNTHSQEAYGILIYTKGNDAAGIYAYGAAGTTIIVLYAGPTDTILG